MNSSHAYVADREALFIELDKFVNDHLIQGKKLAILLININHFRQINIAYGYKRGDAVLDELARRLSELCREQDYIARMGNSEFVLVLPEILNEGHATLAVHKILTALNKPFDLGIKQQKITANMGVSLFPDHAADIDSLIQKAEIALMSARNDVEQFSIYSEAPEQSIHHAWDLEVELCNAQEKDEFEMYFQPQVDLLTGNVHGAEALIRWTSQKYGSIRPDVFIPIAEQTGQIKSITWWTISAALRSIKEWPECQSPLKVSVNLSARMLRDPDLVDSVRSALNIWGTDPERLTLEITESALMEDMSTSFITLEELKSLGINISLDDFGTGYSSMAYFKFIPANELKIDKSFVQYMLESSMDEHIIRTVVDMAHGFDIAVVAEGIENKETYQALKALGCDFAQGYYLAKPMPLDTFVKWVESRLVIE